MNAVFATSLAPFSCARWAQPSAQRVRDLLEQVHALLPAARSSVGSFTVAEPPLVTVSCSFAEFLEHDVQPVEALRPRVLVAHHQP